MRGITAIYLVTLFAIIIGGCNKESKDLNGLWIGAKELNGKDILYGSTATPLVYVNNDSINCTVIEHYDELRIVNYDYEIEFNENKISLLNTDTDLKYRFLGADSISVSYSDLPKKKMVFYRFNKGGVFSKDLFEGHSFSFIGNKGYEVEISFLNDSLYTQRVENKIVKDKLIWKIVNLKGHSFLILYDDVGLDVLHVDDIGKNGDEVDFSGYPGPRNYRFIKVDKVH